MTSLPAAPAPDLDQPLYGASLPEAVRRFFKKYTTFRGRASRSEYWWMMLVETLVVVVLMGLFFTLLAVASSGGPIQGSEAPWMFIPLILVGVWVLATIVPWFAISWRRLHDAGYPGWLFLLSGLPVMNIVFFIFSLMPASPSGDQYNVGAAARPRQAEPALAPRAEAEATQQRPEAP